MKADKEEEREVRAEAKRADREGSRLLGEAQGAGIDPDEEERRAEEEAARWQAEQDARTAEASDVFDAIRLEQWQVEHDAWVADGAADVADAIDLAAYGFGALSYRDAAARIAAQPSDWLVRDIVAEGTYGVLAGEKAAGKTVALLDLAVSVALGEPWFGRFETSQRHALVMTCEDSEAETWRRIVAITHSRGRDPADLEGRLWVHPEPVRMQRAALNLLAEELLHGNRKFGLMVLDPAYKYLAGADSANLFAMGDALTPLQQACAVTGTALIVGHHFNRNPEARRGYRLSGAGLLEWGRVIMELEAGPVADGSRTVTFMASGNSIADVALRFRRTIQPETGDVGASLGYAIEIVAEGKEAMAAVVKPTNDTRIVAVLRAASGAMLVDEVAAAVNEDGGPKRATRGIGRSLNDLANRGVAISDGGKPARWEIGDVGSWSTLGID